MTKQNEIPKGYLVDHQGRLVPEKLIKPIDGLRNDAVMQIVDEALHLNENLRVFKRSALDIIEAFTMLSAEQYNTKLGGKKGNLTLTSFDGRYRVQKTNSEFLTCDERLEIARELINECIELWSEGSRDEIRVLVQSAFKTNNDGIISISKVLGLRQLNIKDKKWLKAMEAITDSIQVTGSKTYIRVYERIGDSDQWERLPLDVSDV